MLGKISHFLGIFVFLSSQLLANGCIDIENDLEFSYLQNSSKGPEHWGELRAEWNACNKGKLQSPIDIIQDKTRLQIELGNLNRNYKPGNAVLVNRGRDIMMKWNSDAGSFYINGNQFSLNQCHWHSPSEHRYNGLRYQLEAHMVHSTPNNQLAVIGILYELGKPDPFLRKILDKIKSINGTQEQPAGFIHPQEIEFGTDQFYYRYLGSLTTPPCTEGVIWTIMKRVKTASQEQIDALREAVFDGYEENARPLQAQNDRNVAFYGPSHSPM